MFKTNSVFDALDDDLHKRVMVRAALCTRLQADGIMLNQLKLTMGLPVPLIMDRTFESFFPKNLPVDQIEKIAAQLGIHAGNGYLLDQLVKDKRAEVKGLESWLRTSKLYLGVGDD